MMPNPLLSVVLTALYPALASVSNCAVLVANCFRVQFFTGITIAPITLRTAPSL